MTGPLRQTLVLGMTAVLSLAVFFVYFFSPFPLPEADQQPVGGTQPPPAEAGLAYREDAMGITFIHQRAARLEDIAHVTGPGVCIADFNGDDLPDVLLVNSVASYEDGDDPAAFCALYLNDGRGRFTSAPQGGGLKCDGLNMGAFAGDYDGDEDLDVYVTRVGPDRLFRNDGHAAFEDVTTAAGIDNPLWGTAAAWADYDRDGHLDLFVTNYVEYDPLHPPTQRASRSDRHELAVFNPFVYPSAPDRLFHNNGDGTFTDVTFQAGIIDTEGKGLGVLFMDFNEDDRPDIYTVNDVSSNGLYLNQGDGTFVEVGAYAAVADPRSGMGITLGDIEGDGHWELFSTHWQDELNVLYRYEDHMEWPDVTDVPVPFFEDVTARLGLSRQGLGLGLTGWGSLFLDADHDGDLDLYWTNGYTSPGSEDETTCVRQPDLFAVYDAEQYTTRPDLLVDVPRGAGRGLAAADLDGDGDLDLVRTNNNGPIVVIENRLAEGNWLLVKPLGGVIPGCRVRVSAGGREQYRAILAGDSYLSCSPPEAHFGLADARSASEVEVRWPDGHRQVWRDVAAGQRFIARREAAP